MGKAAVDISKLSRDEQLDLLDCSGRASVAILILPLSQAHKQELDRRLDDLEGEGAGAVGIAWDDLVQQIRARSQYSPTSFDRPPPQTSSARMPGTKRERTGSARSSWPKSSAAFNRRSNGPRHFRFFTATPDEPSFAGSRTRSSSES
ncbi:MAG: addiction module protein [Candidatus Binatia bacterium]